jgi:hypothetical protein
VSEEPSAISASEGVARSLIAELERGGELETEGRFSIDAGKALAKLREFQLEDPHAYALLLIEASVLAGAAQIEITSDRVTTIGFEFGPLAIHRAELEQLFAHAFPELAGIEPVEQRRRRALQAIAMACNAALSLGPKSIDVDVVGDEQAMRLHITPDTPTGTLEHLRVDSEVDPEGEPGRATRVRVRVERGLSMGLPELELIRARCRLSDHDILINKVQLSVGHRFGLHVELDPERPAMRSNLRRARKVMLGDRHVGIAGLRYADGAAARVWILTNGVLVESFELVDGARRGVPGFGAIVELDFAKDLGQAKLRRGPEYDALIEAIWAAHERVVSDPRRPVGASEPTQLAIPESEPAPELVLPEGVDGFALIGHSVVVGVGFSVWAGMAIAFPEWILATSLVILPIAVGAFSAIERVGRRDSHG